MSFLEQRISPRITAETTFTVVQPSRTKVYFEGGQLIQTFGSFSPKHEVNLAHGVSTKAQFQELVDAFYVVMFGGYEGLRVKNWQDYQLTLSNSAVLSLGAGVYQIQRKHTFGAASVFHNITKPTGVIQVFDASNTLLTSTVDSTTGTFTVASGTPAKVVGEFDLPMTFVNDEWTARLEATTQNLLMVNEPIPMEEVPS